MKTITDKLTGEIIQMTDETFEKKRDELLLLWNTSKITLDKAKESEMVLRKAFVDFAFDQDKNSGTERIGLGSGYQAKTVKKVNYGFIKNFEGKLDKACIDKALEKIEKDGAVGELIAERLVSWTPTLSLSEYKKLSDKHLKIINSVIVTTEGAPTLEIIEPKNK